MSKITGNEPAMPMCNELGNIYSTGLTIRQYYAGVAMQGILSNSEFLKNHMTIDIHRLSVKNADNLISELNKT